MFALQSVENESDDQNEDIDFDSEDIRSYVPTFLGPRHDTDIDAKNLEVVLVLGCVHFVYAITI